MCNELKVSALLLKALITKAPPSGAVLYASCISRKLFKVNMPPGAADTATRLPEHANTTIHPTQHVGTLVRDAAILSFRWHNGPLSFCYTFSSNNELIFSTLTWTIYSSNGISCVWNDLMLETCCTLITCFTIIAWKQHVWTKYQNNAINVSLLLQLMQRQGRIQTKKTPFNDGKWIETVCSCCALIHCAAYRMKSTMWWHTKTSTQFWLVYHI